MRLAIWNHRIRTMKELRRTGEKCVCKSVVGGRLTLLTLRRWTATPRTNVEQRFGSFTVTGCRQRAFLAWETARSHAELQNSVCPHYNYFRDYDPAIGRYVESDPIGLEGGSNTYTYVNNAPAISIDEFGLVPGPRPATPEQTEAARRFEECLAKCVLSAYGLGALVGGGMVVAGQPIPGSKDFVTSGSSEGTSAASRWARSQRWGNTRLPGGGRWPTPTATRPFAKGNTWGKVVGRWVPWVGWGLLISDLTLIGNCVDDCFRQRVQQ